VILADIHAGSTAALLPPGFLNFEANEIKQNPIQEFLWLCWLRNCEWIKSIVGEDPFALVLNGDLIEGIHHGNKQVISPEMGDHFAAAVEILKPLAQRAAKVFVVRGTECHVNNHEQGIGDMLGAEMNPEIGKRVFDRLTLDINGVRHVFRHHIGTSISRRLAATQLSAVLSEEQVEAANNSELIPRVIGCAHRHVYGAYENDNGLCVVSPPWQMHTRFTHKVVSASRTKPGGIILDARGCLFGELPRARKKIFDSPQPAAISL
jgi:hypothetical protein